MKACSFLPAATQMIYDMNLQHHLYGVTFECPATALTEKKKVVRCMLEGKNYSSAEIDKKLHYFIHACLMCRKDCNINL